MGGDAMTIAVFTHRCPVCDGTEPMCMCDGLGVVTADTAAMFLADGLPVEPLPPVAKRCDRPCDSCAFRCGSPEREDLYGKWMAILRGVREGKPFYCHADMTIDAYGHYVPRARSEDGTPAGHPVCAGWAIARRRYKRGESPLRAATTLRKPFADEEK